MADHPRVSLLRREGDVPALVGSILEAPRPVLVLIGGASGLTEPEVSRLTSYLRTYVLPVLHRVRAAVVDGGTDSGVMRAIGRMRRSAATRQRVIQGTRAAADIAAIDAVLVPAFRAADGRAVVAQNRWARREVGLLVLSGLLIVAGSVQAAYGSEQAWPSVLVAALGGVSSVLAGTTKSTDARGAYLRARREAERLRSLAWTHLVQQDPTDPKGRSRFLQRAVARIRLQTVEGSVDQAESTDEQRSVLLGDLNLQATTPTRRPGKRPSCVAAGMAVGRRDAKSGLGRVLARSSMALTRTFLRSRSSACRAHPRGWDEPLLTRSQTLPYEGTRESETEKWRWRRPRPRGTPNPQPAPPRFRPGVPLRQDGTFSPCCAVHRGP